MSSKRNKAKIDPRTAKIALLGILAAQALVLSVLENFIPAIPGLPPGAKPGFSNIVTMFTASLMGLPGALTITVIKSLFAGITRSVTAGVMSICGGFLSSLTMVALLKSERNPFGITGISVMSAIAHNAGQLVAYCVITGTPALVYGYGPFLLLFAVLTGAVTGTILKIVLPALKKQSDFFNIG